MDDQEVVGSMPGFLFVCSNATEADCFKLGLFGLPANQLASMRNIKPTTELFLSNFQSKRVYGIFKAKDKACMSIEPNAWKAALPKTFLAQIRFERTAIDTSCLQPQRPTSRMPSAGPLDLSQVSRLREMVGAAPPASSSTEAATRTQPASTASDAKPPSSHPPARPLVGSWAAAASRTIPAHPPQTQKGVGIASVVAAAVDTSTLRNGSHDSRSATATATAAKLLPGAANPTPVAETPNATKDLAVTRNVCDDGEAGVTGNSAVESEALNGAGSSVGDVLDNTAPPSPPPPQEQEQAANPACSKKSNLLSAPVIARQFIDAYYSVLSTRPSRLSKLYTNESQLSHLTSKDDAGPTGRDVVVGKDAIKRALVEGPIFGGSAFKGGRAEGAAKLRFHAEPVTVDAHLSSGKGVAVLVTGTFVVEALNSGESPDTLSTLYSGRFVQSFFLSPPSLDSASNSATLYVLNDILRLLD